jgi:hypothetical protein
VNIDRVRWPARSTAVAPHPDRGVVLAATVAGLLTLLVGCESPAQKSAWKKVEATTSEAIEDVRNAASESAEDGWQAIKDGSGKAWETTKKTASNAVEEVKKTAGVSEE